MNAAEPAQAFLRLGFNLMVIGMPIALGMGLALRIARAARPRVRYVAALTAFSAAAFLPLATTFLPRQETRAIRTPVGPPRPAMRLDRRAAGESRAAGEAFELAGSSRAGRFAAAGWTGLAVLLLAREAFGHWALARARRRWRPAPGALRRSLGWPEGVALYLGSHDGPFAAGVFTRAVVLPELLLDGCEARAVEAMARHELAHARWRDPLANAVLRIVRCALWVSPALWLLERIVRAESEAAADRSAVASLAPLAPVDYAAELVAVARWRRRGRTADGLSLVTAFGTFSHSGMLEQRVRRLLEAGKPLSGARRAGACAVALAGLAPVALLPLAPPPPDLALDAAARRQAIEERLLRHGNVRGEPARRMAAAVDALIARLPGRDWRAAAVAAELDRLRSDGGVEAVAATLGDPSGRVREKMAWTLGQLGDSRGIDPLLAALGDPSGPVRHTAAWALGTIGDARAVAPLTAALDDADPEVRRGVAWALEHLRKDRPQRAKLRPG